MTINQQLRGTGVAIVTPFKKDESVDYDALIKLTENLILNKVEYIVVLGTTGESVTLTKEEKNAVLKCVKETVNKRIPLILGLGGNDTREIINTIAHTNLENVQAILSVSPYYNKPNQEGIYQHYKTIAKNSPLPIILYNVPARTGSNITAETTLRLAHDVSNIIGIKEASGNIEQCMKIIKNRPDNFLVLSGDDVLTLPIIAAGGDGVISVAANAFPKDFSDMVRKALNNEWSAARKIHYKLLEIMEQLFADGNPGGIKAALKILGRCEDTMRLPLCNINVSVYMKLENMISEYSFD